MLQWHWLVIGMVLIAAEETNGLYGGSDPADNSGTINYVSIRHGGTSIGEDNEINGLTLGGVGTGTTITNVEVIGNQDDGIEFFGGTVNAYNLLVWGQGDDGLDIDQSYSGTISNAIVIANSTSDHGLEIDGPEGSMEGSFKMENIIVSSIVFLVILLTVFKGVKLVPQGSKWVIQRLGKYQSSLSPGLNIVIPYVDASRF